MISLFKRTEKAAKRSRDTWFSKIVHLFERSTVDENVWEEVEELLIAADVGIDTTTKLIEQVKGRSKRENLESGPQVHSALKEEMVRILTSTTSSCPFDQRAVEEDTSPACLRIILVVGVNGSGKTTTIAKLARNLKGDGNNVIIAAADTFRAAAINQLKHWGNQVGVDVIAHQPGSDPGAVAYDAIQAASSRHAQVVIIDTAGRLHTKFNLMEEMKKIKRVAERANDLASLEVLMVMDATTGQNGLAQAQHFTEAIGVDGIFLAKLDGTAKGGIVMAIVDQLKVPIRFIGTGEGIEDLAPFDAETFVEALCGADNPMP